MDSQTRYERAMRSLEATNQKIIELRATFKACRSIVSVVKASIGNITVTGDALISEIKLDEKPPLVSVVETPIVQATNALGEMRLEKQVPIVSVLETHTVSALNSDIKLEEQPAPLVSVFETPIIQVIGDAFTSESQLEKQLSPVTSVQITSEALDGGIKLEEQSPALSVVEAPITQATNTLSEIKLQEKVPTHIISVLETHIVSALISEIKPEDQLPLVFATETHIIQLIDDAPLSDISLEEQLSRISTANIIDNALVSGSKLEEQAPVVSIPETQTVSAIPSQIQLAEQLPLVSVVETPIMQVIDDALIKLGEQPRLVSIVKTPTVQIAGDDIRLGEQLCFVSAIQTPDVQLSSILNSKAMLEEQSRVIALVQTLPAKLTYGHIRETKLQERLSSILKNLPPPSQLPRCTAAEITATAARFEKSIASLMALRNRIAQTKAFFEQSRAELTPTAGGRIRAASVVRHPPPQSPVSLRHSIFTHNESDESESDESESDKSEYEDIEAKDCSATPELDFYDSELESEQSDIEGVEPFPRFESKKARILREKREALAATLTDDMLFNLLLVDCTTKPRLPDNAPIITRKRISKVPIDWEPKYVGKYRAQWW